MVPRGTCFPCVWGNIPVGNKGEGSWVIYSGGGCYLQEHGLSPTALLGASPPGDGYVGVWREAGAMLEAWPSCLVPVTT